MSVFNPQNITFTGKEIMALSEAIYEMVNENPEINLVHQIDQGIKAKQQIGFLGKFGLLGKKVTGCSTTPTGEQLGTSQKYWNPEDVKIRLEECWVDLKQTFFEWGFNNGVEKQNLTNTDFATFMLIRLGDAVSDNILNKVWFNDKSAADVNSTPAGNLTAGTDVDYFNIIDGLWKQIFLAVTADSTRRHTIAENALSTKTLQMALGATTAIDTYRSLVEKADTRLSKDNDAVILTTKSLYDNYLTYKETQGNYVSFNRQTERIETDTFRGIPIIVIEFWDRFIKTYFDLGNTYYLPHRALFTTQANIRIGTEDSGKFSEVDMFFDKYEGKNIFQMQYNIDAKLMESYMFQAAY